MLLPSHFFTRSSINMLLPLIYTDIVLQYCVFLKQTGYKEKAVATFQAMLEYSLFAPSAEMSKKNKMAEFEVFWDSNCPRIGTAEALGWKTSFERKLMGSGKNNSGKNRR